jgi:hypothetical protein
MNAFFIKGQPPIWMVIAGISLAVSVLSRPLAKEKTKPTWTRGVLGSLLVLTGVVVATAILRGGIGLRMLGSDVYGGKRYISILAGIIGFCALAMQGLPAKHRNRDLTIYMLSPITAALSNFAYMLGPMFYFLFLLFPVDMAMGQAAVDLSVGFEGMRRISGFGPASVGIVCFCMMKWGIEGVFDATKPWRFLLFISALGIGLMSGFRSSLGVSFLIVTIQFFAEGLHRTRFVLGFAGVFIVGFGLVAVFSEKLPLSAQRAISFLPVRVDPVARLNAMGSTEWRFQMWGLVAKEVPRYLWFGKGYAIDPTDLYLMGESIKRGYASDYEFSIKAGDYHNGPFSILIPFGIWGFLAFYSFIFHSIRVLWRNMRHGDEQLRRINTVLFSIFVARSFFFTVLFGALESDLWILCSIVGLSLSLNGGMRGPVRLPAIKYQPRPAQVRRPQLAPI